MLFFLSLGLMATAAFSLIQAWQHHWRGTACTYGAEELCLSAAIWLNRRGAVEWATRIICFSELACGLFLISYFGVGFSDEDLLLFQATAFVGKHRYAMARRELTHILSVRSDSGIAYAMRAVAEDLAEGLR